MIVTQIDETRIQVKIDSKLYSSEVIHKCFYWYGGKYSVDIKAEQDSFIIHISAIKKEFDIKSILNKIRIDLIDFKTREIIFNETKNIREILIAKAFASGEELDEIPPYNVNESIGFDPSKI